MNRMKSHTCLAKAEQLESDQFLSKTGQNYFKMCQNIVSISREMLWLRSA